MTSGVRRLPVRKASASWACMIVGATAPRVTAAPLTTFLSILRTTATFTTEIAWARRKASLTKVPFASARGPEGDVRKELVRPHHRLAHARVERLDRNDALATFGAERDPRPKRKERGDGICWQAKP